MGEKNDILKKIIIITQIMIILFSIFATTTSMATQSQLAEEQTANDSQESEDSNDAKSDGIDGGVLLNPLLDLLVTLTDTTMNVIQLVMLGSNNLIGSSEPLNIANFLIRGSEGTDRLATSEEYFNRVGTDENYPIYVNTDEFDKGWLNLSADYYYPMIMYSPQEIFSGRVASLDANFIKSSNLDESSERETLRRAIASWYIGLRNLSAVGLLSVLLFLGIRIIISSSVTDKAKYKQLLLDWFIALLILFFMHYIMSFTLTIVDSIIQGVSEAGTSTITITTSDGGEFTTNLIGAARFQTQYKDIGIKIHFVIMYIALVIYTLIFTFYYIKRLLMMAFLTMIAPLVALTYPIDKITDGKAQAFNSWLKEYVYNALLQPFHLIIYTVFVTNALEFAKSNVIYLIVSLWFVMEAEKILRGFFGFDKASSGTMGALHTLGAASMINKIASGRKHLGGSNVGSKIEEEKPIKFHQSLDLGKLSAPDGQAPATSRTEGIPETEMEENEEKGIRTSEYMPWSTTHEEAMGDEGIDDNGYDDNNHSSNDITRIDDTRDSLGNAENTPRFGQKIKNLAFGNTYGISRKAGKAIKGVAKFGTRTAFRASLGGLAAAIAVASGGDMGAALAAYSAGAGVGERIGNKATNVVGKVPKVINTQIDMANGNNNRRNEAELKVKMKDENNLNYIRDKIIKEEGRIPSGIEVSKKMKNYKPYLGQGLNMKEASKAMGIADKKGIDHEEAALMTAIIKERGITANVLNKDSDRVQAMANMKSELKQKGKSESEQDAITKGVFNFAADFYGVENINQKVQRQEKENKKAEDEKKKKELEKIGEEILRPEDEEDRKREKEFAKEQDKSRRNTYDDEYEKTGKSDKEHKKSSDLKEEHRKSSDSKEEQEKTKEKHEMKNKDSLKKVDPSKFGAQETKIISTNEEEIAEKMMKPKNNNTKYRKIQKDKK